MEFHEYIKWGLHRYGKYKTPQYNIDMISLKSFDVICKALQCSHILYAVLCLLEEGTETAQ
jgi:hypothetical protein